MVRSTRFGIAAIFAASMCLAGCLSALEDQTKATGSILGKKTQDIAEFKPEEKRKVSDSKVKVDDPILYGVQTYGPALEQISKSHIHHALELFRAAEDRYPKDHAEFMERIIKENGIQLPVLPAGSQYQYDVAGHQLVVVEKE